MRVAFYRVLYGQDFIQQSIKSLGDWFDKIYIFWADKPFGGQPSVMYKGELVKFPMKFDNIIRKVEELNDPRIEIIHDWQNSPANQHCYLMHKITTLLYRNPEIFLAIEPDMVFSTSTPWWDIFMDVIKISNPALGLKQVELWKTLDWRVPQRNRVGPIFYKSIPGRTAFNGVCENIHVPTPESFVHNLGFCVSPEVMYWKHLTALSFARIIGDSIPAEDWYEDKWLNWTPDLTDLEISVRYRHLIPKALPYSMSQQDKDFING